MPWPSCHVLLCSYPKPVSVGFMLAPTTMQDGWRDGNVEEASMFQPITVLGPGLVANQHRCCRQLDWTLSLRRQELTSEEMLYLMPKGPPATGFATRVSFEGRFVPGARTCWISFPARYAPCWDALGSESATDSVACIFQAEEYGPDLRHSIQSSFIKQRGCR